MKNYIYLLIVFIIFLCICLVCKGCINIYERLTISGNGDEKCNNINISQNITLNNVCNCKSNENICPQKIAIEYCRQYNNNKSECESAYSLGKNCNCGLDPETYYRCTWDKAYNNVESQCSYYKRGEDVTKAISCKRKILIPLTFKLMGSNIQSPGNPSGVTCTPGRNPPEHCPTGTACPASGVCPSPSDFKLIVLYNNKKELITKENIRYYNNFNINKFYNYYFMNIHDRKETKKQFNTFFILNDTEELKVFNKKPIKEQGGIIVPWEVYNIIINKELISNKYLQIFLIDDLVDIDTNYHNGNFNGYTIKLFK